MTRLSPRALSVPLLPLVALAGAASCGGGAKTTSGPPPPADTTAPFTQASPPGGLYAAGQVVTLTSNESATILYTTDGFAPTEGGVTTLTGPSPLQIAITHDTTLKYRGLDAAGNLESVRTSTYTFDTNPPLVLLGGGLPTHLELLEEGIVTFSVEEHESSQVAYTVEVGGTSTPGTGSIIASGTTTPSTLTGFFVPGYRLPVGQATTVYLFVTDQAGGLGWQPLPMSGASATVAALAGESGSLAFDVTDTKLFVARPSEGVVLVLDGDPLSGTYLTQLDSIAVGAHPDRLCVTPDGTRAYVTCDDGIRALDVATHAVSGPFALGSVLPSGSVLSADGAALYFAGDDGFVHVLDTDSGSGGFHTIDTLPVVHAGMQTGELALTADGTRALLAWTGGGQYGVRLLDTDAAAPNFLAELVQQGAEPGHLPGVAISQSVASRAWLGEGFGRLARVLLADGASSIQVIHSTVQLHGVHPAPAGQVLLLTGGGVVGVRIADENTINLLGFVPAGNAGEGGTGRDLAYSSDGKRACIVRNQGEPSAELQVLTLYP